MITDFALQFNGKYLNILNYINKLENIGINLDIIKIELTKLVSNINSEVESAYDKHESYIINIYIKGIKELNIFESKIVDKYDTYFKIYNYTLYLKSLDITKDNLDEVVSSLIKIIDMMHNSSNINYEEERTIVEELYRTIYEVIKKEIVLNGSSKVYNYTKMYDIDSYFLHDLVSKELTNIDLNSNKNIREVVYKINNEGIEANLFDIDLIREIVSLNSKDNMRLNSLEKVEQLINNVNSNVSKEYELNNRINNDYYETLKIKSRIKELHKKILKRVGALVLACFIPTSCFFFLKKNLKLSASKNYYDVVTKTYNSYLDSTDVRVENKHIFFPKEEPTIIVNMYNVSEDYGDKYLDVSTYEIPSYLREQDYELKDYIKYVKMNNLSTVSKDVIDISTSENTLYNIDYYEVLYKYVDMSTKKSKIDNEDEYINFLGTLVITFIFLILENELINSFNSTFEFEIYIYELAKKIISDISLLNFNNTESIKLKKNINNCLKQLLDLIRNNDKLKSILNEELAKHEDIMNTLEKEVLKYEPNGRGKFLLDNNKHTRY